jgi:3-mercaptopyruvate sulfurtransferase SseA
MQVVFQAARVGGVGIALGVALALIAGVPNPEPIDDPATGVCLPPGGADSAAAPTIQWVAQEDARRKHANRERRTVFVDARSHDAFHTGHIAGAVNVPMDLGTLPPGVVTELGAADTVVCYCDTSEECGQSTRLAALLGSAGLADVRVLEGGLPAWLENGFPAESSLCGEESCE